MSQAVENRRLNEEELFFYEDQICGEADALFRFCIGLTLNQEQALKLLRNALKKASGDVKSLLGNSGSDLRAKLFAYVYREMSDMPPVAGGDSPLFRFLKNLDKEHRMVVIAREVSGLTIDQIAALLSTSTDNVMMKIAFSRKELRKHMNQA